MVRASDRRSVPTAGSASSARSARPGRPSARRAQEPGAYGERPGRRLPSGRSLVLRSQHSASPRSSVSAPSPGERILWMGRDCGFRSSLLPRSAARRRGRASAPARAVAAQDRIQPQPSGSAPPPLPESRSLLAGESRPGFQLAIWAVGQKPPAGLAFLLAPFELHPGLRLQAAQGSPRASRQRLRPCGG